MSGLPILVHGERVAALVVGGGAVALRKVEALLSAGARVRVVAPEITPALRARAAAEPRLTMAERAYEPGDVADAELVFAATDSRSVNAQVMADARALHRLVTVADAAAEGSFGGMAVHRSGEVVIGVSAGGVPGAAARIRDAIAELFGPPFGEAVRAVAALRDRLLRSGERPRWQAASAALIDPAFCDDVRAGRFAQRLAEWR